MSIIEAPEGIRIGPDDQQDENDTRLPLLDFDEWNPMSEVGVMAAGEIKVLTFTGMPTLKMGATIIVRPLNPEEFNQIYLMISHCYVSVDGTVKVIVKNISNEELDFGSDQWNVGGYRFVNS